MCERERERRELSTEKKKKKRERTLLFYSHTVPASMYSITAVSNMGTTSWNEW